MAEDTPGGNATLNPYAGLDIFPDVPTIFVDGVANISRHGSIVRSYFIRTDPRIDGEMGLHIRAIQQVIMPIGSFVETARFFNEVLVNAHSAGAISDATLAELKKPFDDVEQK